MDKEIAAPSVDVVMPTYNHEKYLAQAIESVLSQQTNFPCRILIGDDCSSDNTPAIAKSYVERYPGKIEFISSSENLGALHRERVSVKVLNQCTAKYVAMLEGDDFWIDDKKLQKQVYFLESHPECSISYHEAKMFFEDGSAPARPVFPVEQKEISTLEDVIGSGLFPIPCTILFRNKILGKLPEAFYKVRNADWMLIVLLAERGKLGYLNEVMAAYRVHSGGLWSGLSPAQRIKEQINSYETINEHLGFKFNAVIRDRIAALPEYINQQHARACLDQYFKLAREGEVSKGFRLLRAAVRSAPSEVIRPRRLAAIIKNGMFGMLRNKRVQKTGFV